MLKIYVCGPTVYNDVHIGNLRPIITFDLILKAARFLGQKFYFVHNITDIDDKIIQRAKQLQKTEQEVSLEYAQKYLNILNQFNVDTISELAYVTQNIETMNQFMQKLEKQQSAYQQDGNLWFDVEKYKEIYGQVSNQKLDNMIFEDSQHSKKFPADFALWKQTREGIKFDSFVGSGRPGWHTECSALINHFFKGESLDLHGGGMDLTFPHHENENIQFYALHKKPITKKWLRTGQINLNGLKMSKSLQNVFLADDFLKEYNPDVFKIIILLNGITSIINLDENTFNNSQKLLRKIKLIHFQAYLNNIEQAIFDKELVNSLISEVYNLNFSNFNKKLNDLIKEINKTNDATLIATLLQVSKILGFNFNKFNYQEYVDIFHKWKKHLENKEYQKADQFRAILIKEDLI
ncbi:class I tRNA ligase family protein [Mycoplasmopsis gallopavonis]|uniref:Cysteine--tRNA ligase n=1 Tax=Mycoplasmopsis gallopavonis TaxID=76629 RepID=A0A449AZ36_9BACT|nr:class I tRNA ligase family protein [Mycoplasmopsis gallopavonis]RIV16953.1 cysteine--tRNA ligase [Mycoplasmopsis gallopavonis]VEU72798.1 Cysteine--tRNA ligase [Mycoplasmopsis gallopavonis]